MGKEVNYYSKPEWSYSGDMNAYHGGIWIKHCGDYCEAISITDLDSSCGFEGAVLIERKGLSLSRSLSDNRDQIKSALRTCGQTIHDLAGLSREARRVLIWQSMLDYGYGDSDTLEILQLDQDGPMEFEGWTADRRQTGGEIGGYVMAKYLD